MFKRLRHHFLAKTFMYSLIPWIIILVSFIGIYRYTLGKYEQEIVGRYRQVSESLISELNLIFGGAAHTGYVLASSPPFSGLEKLGSGRGPIDSSIGELIELKNLFSDTAIFNDIIDSLFLYLPYADTVLHSMGTESADLFFSVTNGLDDYPADFWKEFTPDGTAYQLLNATVKKGGTPQERRVIPLIVPRRGSRFYITMLIRESFILRVFENHHITPNTSFSLIAPDGVSRISSGRVPIGLSATGSEEGSGSGSGTRGSMGAGAGGVSAEAYQSASFGDVSGDGASAGLSAGSGLVEGAGLSAGNFEGLAVSSGFSYPDNWQSQTASFILGDQVFTLVTAFPRSDVLAVTYNLRLLIIISMILLSLLSGLISFLLARNISRPVEGLIDLMRKRSAAAEETASAEGIMVLQQGVTRLLESTEALSRNLLKTTPDAVENCMERLLLDRNTTNPWLMLKKLRSYGVDFPFPRFQVVLVRLSPSDELFSRLSLEDISLFYQGAMDLIRQGFPSGLRLWQVGFDEHTLRILVNHPAAASGSGAVSGSGAISGSGEMAEVSAWKSGLSSSREVIRHLDSFISVFSRDAHLKNITIGVGEVHSGVEHIHTSYVEARSVLEKALLESPNSVLLYTRESLVQRYVLPDQDAARFSDYLLQGKELQVLQHLDEIVTANSDVSIGDDGRMKLFFRLYSIVQQVLQAKNLSEMGVMQDAYVPIPLQFGNLSPEVFLDYLQRLVVLVCGAVRPSASHKIERDDVEGYLEENFCRDVSLDDLAERYGTTPVYVSKCIKRIFGVPLTSYLAEKRIAFAAYLLSESRDLSIEEIASICGYNNRIHFTRSFKQRRGVPPTEFRRQLS